ncbi:MAG: ABC transporter permease [Thermoplasmata archaeon]|nr:MAG: ABC transporter permease [Thermoplasmata archaeon]
MSAAKRRKTKVKHHLSFRETMRVIASYLARSGRLWYRFKISFFFTLISMIVAIAIWYFMNDILDINLGPDYKYDYFTFVLVGIVINQYVLVTLSTYLDSLKGLYWSNQLEFYLTSPARLRTFYLASLAWTYLYASINAILYFAIGVFIFGANLSFTLNAFLIIPILFLLIIGLSGIGLISASMFLLADAKGEIEPINWVVSTMTLLVSGVVFPFEKFLEHFPPLYYVAVALPQTWAIAGIRGILTEGSGMETALPVMGILIIFALILFPLGVLMFRLGIRKGERVGSLAKWS